MENVQRFLSLVRRELAAADTRLELGGRPPEDRLTVWIELEAGFRLVAIFDEPCKDAQAVRGRMASLANTFDQTLTEVAKRAPVPRVAANAVVALKLQETLDALCERTSAAAAIVIDDHSPAVWGCSAGASWLTEVGSATALGQALGQSVADGLDLGDWLEHGTGAEQLPRLYADALNQLRTTIAPGQVALLLGLAHARHRHFSHDAVHTPPLAVLARPLLGIYRLVLSFEGEFSELHASSTTTRALPIIERLVRELPPLEPTPKGGRVVPLRP